MGRGRFALLLFALLVAPALAGCLAASAPPLEVTAYYPLNDAAPGRTTQFAVFIRSTASFKQDVDVRMEGLPPNWTFEAQQDNLTLPGKSAATLFVNVTPSANATHGPHALVLRVGGAGATLLVDVRAFDGTRLKEGAGARVHVVAWRDDGALLLATDKVLAGRPGIPRDPSWTDPDGAPWKVYVGGRHGQDPPEPYASQGCQARQQPPCYMTVDPALDARLRDGGDGRPMLLGETLGGTLSPGNGTAGGLSGDGPVHFLLRPVAVDEIAVQACDLPPEVCEVAGNEVPPPPALGT